MKKTFATLAISFLLFAMNVGVYTKWFDDYEGSLDEDYRVLERTGGLNEGERLVPKGAMLGPNDVDSIEYTYVVQIEQGSDLTPALRNIQIHHDDAIYDNTHGLVVYESAIASLEEADEAYYRMEVELSVSLKMPEESDAYNALRGARNLTFDFAMMPAN